MKSNTLVMVLSLVAVATVAAHAGKRSTGTDIMPVVTCNTCHRGQTKPVSIPAIGQGTFANTTREEPGTSVPDPLPTVDQVLDRYYQSIGGKAATQKITTRIIKLSWLRPKLVNGGTPNAAMIARGETWAQEIHQKAPNKYLAMATSPNGIISPGL